MVPGMNFITSYKNEQVKFLKSLSQRKYRDENRCFFVEGLRGVLEGIKTGVPVKKLVLAENFTKSPFYEELKAITGREDGIPEGAEAFLLSDEVFKSICETETPQGIAAVFSMDALKKISGDSIIMLENLQDPGNMGTIIRTADAAGFGGVICTKGCVDVFNQKVIRSTVGSIFHIPVLRQTDISVKETADLLKSKGYTFYAAHPRGDTSCFDESFSGKSVIVIGNEANGLTDEMLSVCDKLLTIPMPGNAESLNASVAAALLIYEKTRKKMKG